MIDFANEELFDEGSNRKRIELIIEGVDEIVTNDSIYTESLRLQESLCCEKELRFGGCEATRLEIRLVNRFGDLTGKTIECNMTVGEDVDILVALGTYKVAKCELSTDKSYIHITAYDVIYDKIQTNVAEWWNGLLFPISIKNLRDSFFAHLGIKQDEVELVQDDVMIDKTIDGDTVSGLDIIKCICEINAVFGKIGRGGIFSYVSLSPTLQKEYTAYKSCEYEEYRTLAISKVQIREETDDIGVVYGSGDNSYIIQGNFLLYGKDADKLTSIASRFYDKAKGITYQPFTAEVIGNPCVEVGDYISIVGRTATVCSYVLARELSGIQALTDTFRSDGAYQYSENVTSVKTTFNQIKGRVSKLTRTLDGLISEVSNLAEDTSTKFEQTVEKINTKVDKGGIISEINQSAEEVRIQAEKISLEGTVTANGTFEISENGTMTATAGKIGGWTIDGSTLVGYSDIDKSLYRNEAYIQVPTSYTASEVPFIWLMNKNTSTGNSSMLMSISSKGTLNGLKVVTQDIEDNWGNNVFSSSPTYKTVTGEDGNGISQELSGIDYLICTGSGDTANTVQIGGSNYNPGTSKGSEMLKLYGYNVEVLAPVGGGALYPSLSSAQSLGTSTNLWSTVYARNTTISTSDRRLKKNIEPISDKYIAFFADLEPCTYKFKDAENPRTHIGYIAQDVEIAMQKHNIDNTEFAGLCIDENGTDERGNTNYSYALRYSEFIALNTAIIQKQQKEIVELRADIDKIKATLDSEQARSL